MENFLYSKTICAFLTHVEILAKKILRDEMGIRVLQKRFEINQVRYPLHFVVFEGPKTLGYFKPDLFEIGLNKLFLFTEEQLLDTLRHELAHYLCWIESGDLTHSPAFRNLCRRYGWGKSVFESRHAPSDETLDKAQRLASKVQKLLALSESHHEHEAKAALKKAQGLLAHVKAGGDEPFVVRRLLQKGRTPPKWSALMAIAKHFGVYPIVNRGHKCAYLEVFGTRAHVLSAEYIMHFLDGEFERLAKRVKPKNKNAFFDGLAKGYIDALTHSDEPGLIALTSEVQKHLWMPYPHLSAHSSRRKNCFSSFSAGKKAGKNLKIRSALERASSLLRIGHTKTR